jgi:hypothetical protein
MRFLLLAGAGAGLAPAAGGQPVPPGISDVVEGVNALVDVSYDVDGDGRFDAGERLTTNNGDLAEQNVEAVLGPVEASVQRTHTVAISPNAQSITVTLSADCRSERPAAGDPLEDFGYARADGSAAVTFRLGSPGNFSISGSAAGSPTQLAIQSNRTESYVELRSSGEVVAQAFGNFFDPGDVPSSIDESGSLAPGLYTLVAACESGAPRGLDGGGYDAPLAESSAQVTLTVTTGECEPEAVSWVAGRAGDFDVAENWDPPRVPLLDEAAGRCDEILIRGGRGLVLDLDGSAAPALALAGGTAPTPIKRTPRFTVDAHRELQPVDGTVEGVTLNPVAGERSVEVINGGSLLLNGGGVFARHLGVGSSGEGAIEVVSPRGYLETTGRLGLGIEGSGSLLVRDGGTVKAAEMVIGEERADGSVTVRGEESTLETGNVLIRLPQLSVGDT